MLGHGRFKFETPNVIDPGEDSLSQPTRRPRGNDDDDENADSRPTIKSPSSPPSRNSSYSSNGSNNSSDYVYKKPLGATKAIKLDYGLAADDEPDADVDGAGGSGSDSDFDDEFKDDEDDAEYGKVPSSNRAVIGTCFPTKSASTTSTTVTKSTTRTSKTNLSRGGGPPSSPEGNSESARLYGATLLSELERRESKSSLGFTGKLSSVGSKIWNGRKFSTTKTTTTSSSYNSNHNEDESMAPLRRAVGLELERDGLMWSSSSSQQKRTGQLRPKAKWCCIVLIVIGLCAGFIVLTYKAITGRNNQSTRMSDLIDVLSQNGISTIEDLTFKTSPQHKAASWIADIDQEELDIPQVLDDQGSLKDKRLVQRYVLTVLYYAWDGPHWNNQLDFVTANHECSWDDPIRTIQGGDKATINKNEKQRRSFAFGVSCDDDLIIESLSLPSNDLKGMVPREIHFLDRLEYLGLSKNSLEGTFPSLVSDLSHLKELAIDDNIMTGDLFESIGSLTSLQYLYAEDNEFVGKLDDESDTDSSFVGLTNLIEADLSGNSIQVSSTNVVPATVFALPILKVLDLAANDIRGSLPDISTTNTVLEYLNLRMNAISSTIPGSFVSNLGALTHLDLESNALTGNVPAAEIANTWGDQLSYLFLGKNPDMDSGEIPNEFQSLTKLRELSLDDINLTGKIPEWIENLPNLRLLDLRYNELTGTIDGLGWEKLGGLAYLLLNDNKFMGPIPTDTLGGLDELAVLSTHHNGFTGDASDICSNTATDDGSDVSVQLFTTDCGAVACDCCDDCCDGDDCYEGLVWDSLEHSEGSWEEHFKRTDYSFNPHIVFGP